MADIFGYSMKKSDILERVGDITQLCDARRMIFTEGKSSGVEVIEVKTGSGFAFTVLPSRGLDISNASFKGIPLAWKSSTGETSPFFYQPEGYEWLYSFFGGLLTTCGLTYNFHPCEDEGKQLGLHGRVSNIPAEDVNVLKEWAGDEHIIKISGKVRESSVFGDNLVLSRSITTSLGARKLLIQDKVENVGFKTSPLMMLYHVNAGWPIVSEHSMLISPTLNAIPRDEAAKTDAKKWASFLKPQKDFSERVYFHELIDDRDGIIQLGIVNENQEIGLSLKYPKTEFPYFIEWKMMGQGEYVVGIEPSNCTGNRAEMRKKGILEFIQPGQKRNFTLEIGVLSGIDEINTLKEKIKGVLST